MEQKKINYQGISYLFEKEEKEWVIRLKRSDVPQVNEAIVSQLNISELHFLPSTVILEEDEIVWNISLPDSFLVFSEMQKKTYLEKLMLLLRLKELVSLSQEENTLFLYPDFLVFDLQYQVSLAYRGVKNIFPPKEDDENLLLGQLKALAVVLFDSENDFLQILESEAKGKKLLPFLRELCDKESLEEFFSYISDAYDEEKSKQEANNVYVRKIKYRVYQHVAIWVSILALLLAIPLVNLIFFQQPFERHLEAANTHFVESNYEQVIQDLSSISDNKFPNTQKYELAYSYVQGAQLSKSQKTAILNNVNINSNSSYLDYWIAIGRGNLDSALDLAKGLNDNDLILYALNQLMIQVQNDPKLTGASKASANSSLQGEYSQYSSSRSSVLDSSSTSSSSKKTSNSSHTSSGKQTSSNNSTTASPTTSK